VEKTQNIEQSQSGVSLSLLFTSKAKWMRKAWQVPGIRERKRTN
jgi:hypothetical protein